MHYSLSNPPAVKPKPDKPERDPASESSEEEEEHVLQHTSCSDTSMRSRITSTFEACLWAFWCLCTFMVLTSAALGILLLYSKTAKMEMVFSNRINLHGPFFANLSDCNSFGLVKCENLQLRSMDGKIGAWLISPASKQYITREAYILYLHGNMGNRAMSHRVKTYQKLSKMGYHVLAIDYRGFGDSESFPTEQGLVEDAKAAYKWMAERYVAYPHYIWGHSLGAGVALQLAAWLNSEHSRLNGVVLEAPFNNMTDCIKQFPLAAPFVPLIPNFDSYISDMKNVFRNNFWIKKVTTPIAILHDKSDEIINIALGRRLYYASKEVGSANVEMVELDENLGHKHIYSAKKLKGILSNFIYNTS